jgi:hypothetical protein
MTDTEKTPTDNDEKSTVIKNKNKRRMAWVSLISILIVTGLMMFAVPIERLDKLSDVVTWFYMSMATVIGAYMGASVYAHVKGK